MKWNFCKELHEMATIKMTHKFLNSESDHYYTKNLKQNRNVRSKTENKTGPHLPNNDNKWQFRKQFSVFCRRK